MFLFVLFSVLGKAANAASLYFSPSSGSYGVGGAFSVSIYTSSPDQAMNAASGIISYPPDKLEVTGISKAGSIITLWVQEPSFSNSVGTVNFEGIILNPGFIGSLGKIITVNFKIKAAGSAALTFSSGSVLANDGKGTNILASLGGAGFSFGAAGPSAPEATTPSEAAGVPLAPRISSSTHPDPNKWYRENNPKFTWDLPENVTGVRLLVGELPSAVPITSYIPPVSSKEISGLNDGVWYFHARFKNQAGWGEVSHFRFQIDSQKPDYFEIKEIIREDLTEPKAKFVFNAEDKTSGIDFYEIQIDAKSPEIWQDDGRHIYETAVLWPGKHILIAKATDRAGNSLANSVEFIIEPLESPFITEWPKELESGEQLIIKGTTKYPNAQIIAWLERQDEYPSAQIITGLERQDEAAKSRTTRSDKDGNFIFAADEKPKDGVYGFWAEVMDERGAKSLPTEKITIAVKPSAFLRIGSKTINLLSVAVPIIALIVLMLFVVWYGWHKFNLFKKRLRKEVGEAEQALHKAFNLLREEIQEQIKLLEKTRNKRGLTKEEQKILKQLKKDLDDAERFVGKELKDIEKEVK
ncbi:MAG: hypothetical protein A3I20_02225 [Candidatus Portnoybacteria bacterium RIFCSPLOWO2_02_FULL_40_15]|uniref:Cohesin domain-containing protein n=1 Tax=Candidatus Portnoybacteria bacterium RIFCSPLOWO2_02_FULL_40_15 TaxID=1802002 RepID=A0A1G2FT34_9BACT|nr:MAG: hypothetical protein A3I20_02225 [Candidatus Portnoybacteria bacterium RIFCSPLOWO2_02_FULL_40_15]